MVSGVASVTPVTTLEVKLAGVEGDVNGDGILSKEDAKLIVKHYNELLELNVEELEIADVTAMALQTLAKYRDREDVGADVERGLKALEAAEYTTSEAVSQTIVALSELEIRCDTLLKNLDKLSPGKTGLVPKDGVLLEKTTMTFEPGGVCV